MNGEKAEGGREKCARKKTAPVFRCGEEGRTEGGIDLREVCAGENIFTKFRNDTVQLMESVRARGEGKAMLMKQEKRKFRWRGDKERENK